MLGLLLLATASFVGCPAPDPHTQSRITNDSLLTVEIEVALDKTQWRHGFEPAAYEQWLTERTPEWIRDELSAYAKGEGVELIDFDAAQFSGRFRVRPSGVMIVNDSMGTRPYVRFSKMTVTKGEQTASVGGEEEIVKQFKPIQDEPGLYEIRITELF